VYQYDVPHQVEVAANGELRGVEDRVDPASLVETHSLVHTSQLSTLRDHHMSVRTRDSNAVADDNAVEADVSAANAIADDTAHHAARGKRSWLVDVHGVIPLTNLRDSQYVGPIGVGTGSSSKPESVINVVFDTGSTNLWIASTLCQHGDCTTRARYDPTASSTYTTPAEPVQLDITFGTGELKGPQGVDYFRVGPYVVKDQTFGMIESEVGSVFHEIAFEGILGLAFPSMSARGVEPFFDNVMEQNVLGGHNELSFYMTKLPTQGSAVFFGGVDERFFEGSINYFPVMQEHYWSLDLIDFRIGEQSHTEFLETGEQTGPTHNSNFIEFKSTGQRVSRLILDSGTTYFTAPPGLFSKIMDRLPGANCNEVQSYPQLHYILKDVDGKVHDVSIPPSVYMVSSYGDGWCDLSFMEIPVPDEYGPAFIFGEVFMREWYTVFNRRNGQKGSAMVGFAKAKKADAALQTALSQSNELDAW